MSRRVLVTGFTPFADVPTNPSAELLPHLPNRIADAVLHRAVLPVDTDAIGAALAALYAEAFDVVVHVGVAVDRSIVTLETTAHNERSFRVADNGGRVLSGQPVVEGAPADLPSRLAVPQILQAWHSASIPSAASHDAGRFLCNQTMYLALHGLPARTAAGFVHIPPDEVLGRATGKPHVPLAVSARAIELAVAATLSHTAIIA